MALSFLTCIGKLMDGSGLKEALSLVYASNSVETMLHGHAYGRAVRRHFLVHLALMQIIIESVTFEPDELSEMQKLSHAFNQNSLTFQDVSENAVLISVRGKINEALEARQFEWKNGETFHAVHSSR